MPTLSLNKSALNGEKQRLEIYGRFLPSLKLKRQQLLLERNRYAQQLAQTELELQEIIASVGEDLPMLANQNVNLSRLVEAQFVSVTQERLLGLNLPALNTIEVRVASYPYLGTPHWLDALAARLGTAIELSIRRQVHNERFAILERALKKVNQRINLFEKVLIPQTRQNLARIGIALADEERAAVVRAKLAKRKTADKSA